VEIPSQLHNKTWRAGVCLWGSGSRMTILKWNQENQKYFPSFQKFITTLLVLRKIEGNPLFKLVKGVLMIILEYSLNF